MRGATTPSLFAKVLIPISIHAPRAGSDICWFRSQPNSLTFQSTLPVRGATWVFMQFRRVKHNFNPRSPCGERLTRCGVNIFPPGISIHAPRAGSDGGGYCDGHGCSISIHAPRAGSDACGTPAKTPTSDFNPRSPCGERPVPVLRRRSHYHFNPRSPCGERQHAHTLGGVPVRFQSTLPVRGATISRSPSSTMR